MLHRVVLFAGLCSLLACGKGATDGMPPGNTSAAGHPASNQGGAGGDGRAGDSAPPIGGAGGTGGSDAGSDVGPDAGPPPSVTSCGNAQIDDGEQCDDGNDQDADGCDHMCR